MPDFIELRGFLSPLHYDSFLKDIESQLRSGLICEVRVDPDYGPGEIYGGRWFKKNDTGEIWRLVPPDFPFRGLWEPVRVLHGNREKERVDSV